MAHSPGRIVVTVVALLGINTGIEFHKIPEVEQLYSITNIIVNCSSSAGRLTFLGSWLAVAGEVFTDCRFGGHPVAPYFLPPEFTFADHQRQVRLGKPADLGSLSERDQIG